MALQDLLRKRQAAKRGVLGGGMLWCIPGSGHSPTGTGAPGRPCLRGQPGTPAMLGATPAAGPPPCAAWSWPSRCTCPPLSADWGAAERGGGRQQHATALMPFASIPPNTGDGWREEKASGQEAREPPTTRHGPPAESDGASESARGNATDPRMRTAGAGPSPGAVRRTKGRGAHSTQRTRQLCPRRMSREGWRQGRQHGCTSVHATALETAAPC
jgi:hypothetical protein